MRWKYNENFCSAGNGRLKYWLLLVALLVTLLLGSWSVSPTRENSDQGKAVLYRSEGKQDLAATSERQNADEGLWQLHTAASRLNSNRAGHLSSQLGELIGIAKQHRNLAEEMQDTKGASEIEQEILSSLELFQEMEIEELEESLEMTVERVEEKLSKLNSFLLRLEAMDSKGRTPLAQLRSRLKVAEEQIRSIDLQSKLYSQIATKTVPPGMHCLSMRLTVDFLLNGNSYNCSHLKIPPAKRFNKGLYHYALFSDNILAIAVVVNSTAQNLKQPWKHVFHVVTDKVNCPAVKAWFCSHPPGGLSVDVTCLQDYPWVTPAYVPVLHQMEKESLQNFYFQKLSADRDIADEDRASSFKFRNPKYLSILNHLRFYLPEVFPDLDKIMFLDDDVVVQKDLSSLWKVDMGHNINLAVETCGVTFHRFWTYLNFSHPLLKGHFDPQGCAWAFGMNLFNLKVWRNENFTLKYNFWQQQNENRTLWKLGTLPAGLLTFYNKTMPLERSWQVLGLGSLTNLSTGLIENAGVLHFNGHAKPWLELAISKYRIYWKRYLDFSDELLKFCEVR